MAKAKLLVVEDEPNLLLGIRDILELDGYRVLTASHGQQALDTLEGANGDLPDLIVSDIMMPHMDGIELLEQVRKKKDWLTIPFIFLTAKGEKQDIQRGKRMGVDDYLIKPFDADDLLVAVDSRLRRHKDIHNVQQDVISGVKRSILTILNHEFRTPLTLVVAYADMLKENHEKIEDMNEDELLMFLKEISSGADRLRRLIENFILLVEMEAGDATKTFEWRKHPIEDIRPIIESARAQIFDADIVQHTCEVNVPEDFPTFIGDREYLMVIFRELMDNARKFSDPSEPIKVKLSADEDEVTIEVIDRGRGIPPQEVERICDTFYQINREQFEDQGAGSGLAITSGLVKMHGGTIAIDSTPGEGSTFTVKLPIALITTK